jgi:crotonobetainyl-CoA:carnitine CoA-transferase CaiB-like acyl-CoA transferase
VPCAPVNDVAAALADVQVAARQAVVEIPHPVLGATRQIASPLRLDGYTPPAGRAPFRGEHTASVLRELCGYTDERIAALARDGVFGDALVEVPT